MPHAAADYGRDWSTASGVTPSHMQEVGSLVSRQRIELNQPGKVVVKIPNRKGHCGEPVLIQNLVGLGAADVRMR